MLSEEPERGEQPVPLVFIYCSFPQESDSLGAQMKVLATLSQILTKAPDLPDACKNLGFSWLTRRQFGGLWPKTQLGL